MDTLEIWEDESQNSLWNLSFLLGFSNSPEEDEDSLLRERNQNQILHILQTVPIVPSMAFLYLKRTSYRSVACTGGENETQAQRPQPALGQVRDALLMWSVFSPALHSVVIIPSWRCSGLQHFPCAYPCGSTLACRNHFVRVLAVNCFSNRAIFWVHLPSNSVYAALFIRRGQITVNKRHSNWLLGSLHLKKRRKTTNQKKEI